MTQNKQHNMTTKILKSQKTHKSTKRLKMSRKIDRTTTKKQNNCKNHTNKTTTKRHSMTTKVYKMPQRDKKVQRDTKQHRKPDTQKCLLNDKKTTTETQNDS